MEELCRAVCAGEFRAIARACRIVDDRLPGHRALLAALYPRAGRAWVLGVTGSAGVGKSTLIDRLLARFRAEGLKLGVLAVDPSSPFSGGAVLGDRIRMQQHFADPGVFIRSLGTRGARGGLSRSLSELVCVLDAAGFDVILVETVGVGQDELDVMEIAHTTLLVVAPGMGDQIQALKAGILEIADVFALNKADREGADSALRDLEERQELGRDAPRPAAFGHAAGALAHAEVTRTAGAWTPRIVKTVATRDVGVVELGQALAEHRAWLGSEAGQSARAQREGGRVRRLLGEMLLEHWLAEAPDVFDDVARRVELRALDPYAAVAELAERLRQRELTATR